MGYLPTVYDLLDAVNLRNVRTTADVAARLGVDESEAPERLRDADRDGFVTRETDLSASLTDDRRQFWTLTPEGRHEWDRLEAERTEPYLHAG